MFITVSKLRAAFVGVALLANLIPPAVTAKTLEGNVQQDDTITRLERPGAQNGGVQDGNAPLRIARPVPQVAPSFRGNNMKGLVDTTAFAPLRGNAQDNGGKLGLVQPGEFAPLANAKFDLGADRGSRELVLAWEAWHKQLSHEIYSRWSEVAMIPGKATVKVTVTKDRQILTELVDASGNRRFDHILLDTIHSLNGDPGLTFPAKSERQEVSFEADYIAATDVKPGFSWVKNDYEKVQQSY